VGSVQIVEDAAAAHNLWDEWRSLAIADHNAFTTPEWFSAALASYPEDTSPFLAVLINESGVLKGVAPLVRTGAGGRAVIRFGGANLGDLFTLLAADGQAERELVSGLGRELGSRRDWGSLVLENVPDGSGWVDALARSGKLAATRLRHRDEVLPYADLSGASWEDFLASKSRNFRSQLGRKQRKLERDHDVRYRLVTRAEDLPGALDDFERLHHARWDARGGSQALTERSRAFHGCFAAAALERGWLRLWLLEVDGAAVAAWYGWRVGGRYAYYLAGFDGDWGRHSVGLLLQAHTVRAAIEEGADTYDLLLGGEEYKARFADAEVEVRSYTLTRRVSAARVMASAEALARSAADRLTPERRAKLKAKLGGLARRAPSKVRR
jgi:CelD/BcsL family acetyltransferase involved in cellulose biosynthesis